MSVQKRTQKGKTTWVVRYRAGGRQLSRSFDLKRQADKFEADKKLRGRHPRFAAEFESERITLKQYIDGPFQARAATRSQARRDKYRWALEKHLADLAHEPLVAIDALRVGEIQAKMLNRGDPATPTTVREVLAVLHTVMATAIGQGILPPGNPVGAVPKVPAEPAEEVQALAPAELEELIDLAAGRERAIVILGGRVGLRPGELRLVPWTAIDGDTLTLSRTIAKRTASRTRVIYLDPYTVSGLKEWRLQAGRPDPDTPIIGEMTANALKLWGTRWLRPRVKQITSGRITDATVKTLRHSHASALHHTLYTEPAILRRMGHGVVVHHRTYAHIMDGVKPTARYEDLDALYAAARTAARAHTERTSAAT